MGRYQTFPDRALELAQSVGDNIKQAMPHANKWFKAGAKYGALKGGARVAGSFVRRNPALIAVTLAGTGLLWYAAKRKARRAQEADEAYEGSARRVEARRRNRDALRDQEHGYDADSVITPSSNVGEELGRSH